MSEDLQDLLNQLSSDPPEADVSTPKKSSAAPIETVEGNGLESAPIQKIIVDEASLSAHIPTANNPVDLHKYLNRLDGVTDEILAACRADRQEAQDMINMIRHQIEDSLNQNRPPSRMYIDGMVKAVEVKANINMTAVKMIEANAKMLAATKATSNVLVSNNVSVGGDLDLEKILSEPITQDDEY